ncbi:MAG: hypothetical protein AAGA90_03150 [Actinomycetota bacterium]
MEEIDPSAVSATARGICSQQLYDDTNNASWVQLRSDVPILTGQSLTFGGTWTSPYPRKLHVKVQWYAEGGVPIGNADHIFGMTDGVALDNEAFSASAAQVGLAPADTVSARINIWHGVSEGVNQPGSVVCVDDFAAYVSG